MDKLLLVDGNAILHRAYHALPPLTNPKGETVNAAYGFFSMILTVAIDLKPEYVIVCFDRPKPTFRQQIFAGYQQHRPSLAEDFVPQIVLVHEMLAKLGVVVRELDGYEADDVIGTIAEKAEGLETVILTGDRDLLQLVRERVKVLAPVVGVKNTVLYDSEKVQEKFGVTPEQFVDYKALVGDASDGYPGVSGIGPKTASGLLNKYGTFDNLYAHVGLPAGRQGVPEKVGLKLATDAEQAALAKKLAKIVTDAPVTVDFKDCGVGGWSLDDWLSVFEEQGFKSLMGRATLLFGGHRSFSDSRSDGKEEKEVKKKGDEPSSSEGKQLGLLE